MTRVFCYHRCCRVDFTFEVRDRELLQVDGVCSEGLINLCLIVENVAQLIASDFVFIRSDVNCGVYLEGLIGFTKKKKSKMSGKSFAIEA